MELKEIINLIQIRDFIVNTINNPAFDRATVNDLIKIQLLLDKKIIIVLRGPEFKDYINFVDAQKVIEEAAKNNNIKSGLKKYP